MKYFSMLIKPASSLCNLRCKYCFYCDVASHRDVYSYGVMNDETISNIVERTVGYFNEEAILSFAFQGGEPTCAGIEYFRKFVSKVKEFKKEYHTINYSIQTNGTLINEEWLEFFKENNFLVGLSLDGFENNNDYFRKDSQGEGTYSTIMNTISLLKKHGIEFNILTVLTSKLSESPKELYEFYRTHELDHIQLIPCLSEFDSTNDYALTPKQFNHFYSQFFDCWLDELRNNKYRSVSLFDNIIPMFVGKPPVQCGYLGFCSMQFVTEADGSVYPCDFYVLDQYKIGNINQDTIVDLAKSAITSSFLRETKKMCSECKTCPYELICHGNCKRMYGVYYDENYCGLKELLSSKEKEIIAIANTL